MRSRERIPPREVFSIREGEKISLSILVVVSCQLRGKDRKSARVICNVIGYKSLEKTAVIVQDRT